MGQPLSAGVELLQFATAAPRPDLRPPVPALPLDDDAAWLCYFDGELQTFADGEAKIHPLASVSEPIRLGDAVVAASARFTIQEEATTVFILGLAPSRAYDVEPDAEEMHQARSDPGGILELKFPGGFRGGIRIRKSAAQ